MKTIKKLKDVTTLETGDVVVFGHLEYKVRQNPTTHRYYLYLCDKDIPNEVIFEYLNLHTGPFIESIGINACTNMDFPEVKSLEALTAIVSALFKEYEKQNELPKTWEEFCERNKMGDKKFCLYDGVIIGTGVSKNIIKDSILIDSPEKAQAFRALMQLHQLRKAYVKNWEPDYKQQYYGIISNVHGIDILPYTLIHKSMSFPTHELAEQFLNNFKDLLEIAKPLL